MTQDNQAPSDRYWLFAGGHFYPYGGFRDFYGSFASVEEAVKKSAEVQTKLISEFMSCWWNVIDAQSKEIIQEGQWK